MKSKQCLIVPSCYPFPLQKDALGNFKCGAEHLLSPLASKPAFALKADAALTMSVHLTAVTVAVENDHTIAFLGSANGEVFKVEFSCGFFVGYFFPQFKLLSEGRCIK